DHILIDIPPHALRCLNAALIAFAGGDSVDGIHFQSPVLPNKTGPNARLGSAGISNSRGVRGSMIGTPSQMTKTPGPVRNRHGRVVRCLEGGAFDRRRVLAR